MEKITNDSLKNAALMALAVISVGMGYDARQMRQAMKENEGTYQYFLAKKSGGRPLYTYIAQDSLSLFPMKDGSHIVCGIVPVNEQSSRQKP